MQLHFPHDDHAERALLGSVLLDARECWPIASELLHAGDFYAPRNTAIWRAMRALARAHSAIDLVLVRGQLESEGDLETAGGDEYLISLTDVIPTTAHTADMAKRVHDLASVREVMRQALEVAAEGSEPMSDVVDYLDRAGSVLARIAERRSSDVRMTSLSDALDASYTALARRQERGQSLLGHSCGMPVLDHAIGGFVPGDLIVVAGRPGMGKTALANAIKLGIAQSTQRPVLSLELEMSGEQLTHRLLASEGGINLRRIRSAQLSAEELRHLAITADELSRLPVYFIERRDTRISELRREARRLAREKGPLALVLVDYLQIARSEARREQREREVADISGALKSLAGELQCPVVALSQLNRGIESRSGADRRPRLSDLRESGAIEQDADTVIFIHREEVYDPNTEKKGIAEIVIAKQRSGPLGTVCMAWQSAFTRFEPLAECERPPTQESFGYDAEPAPRSNGRGYS
jgi:replicative DNA helicase